MRGQGFHEGVDGVKPNILMISVRYYNLSPKCIADEVLFAKHLKGDTKEETIFYVWRVI